MLLIIGQRNTADELRQYPRYFSDNSEKQWAKAFSICYSNVFLWHKLILREPNILFNNE